jgi:hypothetical protein
LFRQLFLGSDFMGALPTATTARTLHDPLPYCDAARPVGALLPSKMHALPPENMKQVTFEGETSWTTIHLETNRRRRIAEYVRPSMLLRIERPARPYLHRGGHLIEHEERALSDQTDLQPIPQPHPTLVDIWPKN